MKLYLQGGKMIIFESLLTTFLFFAWLRKKLTGL